MKSKALLPLAVIVATGLIVAAIGCQGAPSNTSATGGAIGPPTPAGGAPPGEGGTNRAIGGALPDVEQTPPRAPADTEVPGE